MALAGCGTGDGGYVASAGATLRAPASTGALISAACGSAEGVAVGGAGTALFSTGTVDDATGA
ncbi:MAG TPA: hypothetical protein DHB48_06315 [Sphingobium sp.]|nr:hypothetical protein [Sphingobium sp.]